MNFIVAFILEISGFEEFETFNFLINFWKKRRNLYFGIFDENFLLIGLISLYQYLSNNSKRWLDNVSSLRSCLNDINKKIH